MDKPQQPNEISEQTVIPLGFLALILGGMGGGLVWLSNIQTTAAQARDGVAEIKQDRQAKGTEMREQLRDINSRLSRMEGILQEIKSRR